MPVPAFKEWAVIVRALLQGEQLLDVRKGGLREEGRHFAVRSQRLWLLPTYEHQRAELLKPAYRRWIDEAGEPDEGSVRIAGWADVVGVTHISDRDALAALDSKFIWNLEYAEARLRWKARDPLWILALRVYRLSEPLDVELPDDAGGCTSWVDLPGLPDDPAALPSEPALSDESFSARLELAERVLPAPFESPVVAT